MAKKILHDMVSNKRRLSEVLPTDSHKPSMKKFEPPAAPVTFEVPQFERAEHHHSGGSNSTTKIVLTTVGFLALLVVFYFISSLLARVTVKVVPQQATLKLNDTYQAFRSPSAGALAFQIMTTQVKASKTVTASGTKAVQVPATGSVRLYNALATATKLVASTRLAASNGKIYRLQSGVTIPAAVTKGQTVTPGQTDVKVTADAVGPDYNQGNTDFTIPAYQGTAKATKVYGRSISALTGGASGNVAVVNATDKTAAQAELEPKLKAQIIDEARHQIPPNFILYDDATIVTFQDATSSTASAASSTAQYTEQATLTGILINKDELATYLANKDIPKFDHGDVGASDLSEIQFKLNNKDSFSANSDTIGFTLTGSAHIIWKYDGEQLRQDLYAATDHNYQAVFGRYPSIASADIIFQPPWVRALPKDPKSLIIQTILKK